MYERCLSPYTHEGAFMVNIKIRLDLNMKGKLPTGTFQALQAQVEKRLKNKYPELNVDIGWGAHTSLNIDGLKKNEKKDYIEEVLQEIWEDDSWLPEGKQTEDIEYFDK